VTIRCVGFEGVATDQGITLVDSTGGKYPVKAAPAQSAEILAALKGGKHVFVEIRRYDKGDKTYGAVVKCETVNK
jgi:hypothetical protein